VTGQDRDSLIDFPCDYTFKAFGRKTTGTQFESAVQRAVSSVVPVGIDAVKSRSSSQGHYTCVSVVVQLHNRDQLVRIYAALRQLQDLCYLL